MAAGPQPGGGDTVRIDPPQRLLQALSKDPDSPAMAWLANLAATARQQLADWELTPERVQTPGGLGSLVVLVRQADGTPAALKFPVPGPAAGHEREALGAWDGWGAVQLLRADPGTGALLLERLHSAVSLRSLPEAKALLEAAGTVRKLWVEPPSGHAFPTVAELTDGSAATLRALGAGGLAAEARPLLDEALALRTELAASEPEQVLLHGDFRQAKVLAGDRAPWLAVGPAPVVGERAYDLARLVLDRFEDVAAGPGPSGVTRRRVAKLADSLDVDRDRLRGWALFRAVDSGLRQVAAGNRRRGELLLEFAGWL
ncbi:aminoglycoside phosphotransferase family protein [Streptomyces sp. XD-27]|uniref:aminoglycoside phosphotransferase family protein n=1 Tax=Streptomyces sp. XD-27 TaxID=3062779 RepID=UPI0026F4351B|nr:aminoglycoside phosphotransferase family protein [Streptomyces sp. XD-27]WKX72893.1 aminoglycoside phosphotransferase family protein [Streptomyces sp. XD-27]